MKKILAIMSAVGLTATTTTAVISCGDKTTSSHSEIKPPENGNGGEVNIPDEEIIANIKSFWSESENIDKLTNIINKVFTSKNTSWSKVQKDFFIVQKNLIK